MRDSRLDDPCINTMPLLTVDTVQQANSGHPGTPMGVAPLAYVLWDRFPMHNPNDLEWPDQDRLIQSPCPASLMLYSLLHFTGHDLFLEELKCFKQRGSKSPGDQE